jgi:hypothetical protein
VVGTDRQHGVGFKLYRDGEALTLEVAGRPSSSHPFNTDVHFSLKWDPHSIQIQIGSENTWVSLPVGFAPLSLKLFCSTGEVVFHGLDIKPSVSTP